MSKYIDAEKLIKSVNRYRDNAKAAFNPIEDDADYYKGKIDACEDMQKSITSLQQEQLETDGDDGKFVKILVRKEFAEQLQKLGAGQSSFIEAINPQEQPSLSCNLDKAAKEYFEQYNYMPKGFVVDAFKAGAKWMANQGETFNGYISIKGKRSLIAIEGKSDICKFGDKVIVQIRRNKI